MFYNWFGFRLIITTSSFNTNSLQSVKGHKDTVSIEQVGRVLVSQTKGQERKKLPDHKQSQTERIEETLGMRDIVVYETLDHEGINI